jgi:hypothetical protein
MWFMGGRHISSGGRPLVVLSLEPLVADHYPRQIAFATQGFNAYTRWQLDYFDVFPTPQLAGIGPQPYWAMMFHLVAGFVGASPEFDWRTFRDAYIEIPLVPLHAPHHENRAFRKAADVVKELLHERLRLVTAHWPDVVVFCAGAPVADGLPPVPGVADEPLDIAGEAQARRDDFGNALFTKPIVRRTVDIGKGKVVTVFVRRAPFAQGHQPTQEGLRFLGKMLREFKA